MKVSHDNLQSHIPFWMILETQSKVKYNSIETHQTSSLVTENSQCLWSLGTKTTQHKWITLTMHDRGFFEGVSTGTCWKNNWHTQRRIHSTSGRAYSHIRTKMNM